MSSPIIARRAIRLAILGLLCSIAALALSIMSSCEALADGASNSRKTPSQYSSPPSSHHPGSPISQVQKQSVTQKQTQSQKQSQNLHQIYNPSVTATSAPITNASVSVNEGDQKLIFAPGLGGFGSGPCMGTGTQGSLGIQVIALGLGRQELDDQCTLRGNIATLSGLANLARQFNLETDAQQVVREALAMRQQLKGVPDAQALLKAVDTQAVAAPEQISQGIEISRVSHTRSLH